MGQGKLITPRLVAGVVLMLAIITSAYLLGTSMQPAVAETERTLGELDLLEMGNAITQELMVEIGDLKRELKQQEELLTTITTQLAKDKEEPVVIREPVIVREPVVVRQPVPVIVHKNDTIWGIAARFQSPPSNEFMARIMDLNGVDAQELKIGQTLLIPLETE